MPAATSEYYSKNYSKFVKSVISSPDKMEKLKSNPSGIMKKAGLTQKEMSLIRSGKQDAILAKVNPMHSKMKSSATEMFCTVKVAYFQSDR